MKKLILLAAPLSIAALAPVAISASCDGKKKQMLKIKKFKNICYKPGQKNQT